jgi:hypothetical protein
MIQIRTFFIALIAILAWNIAFSQTPAEYEANYAKRIQLEEINGVYIPKDLDDAFAELNRLSDQAGIEKFKNAPESSVAQSHFGLQKWVELNWGLEEGSRISHYLKQKGISKPEDMSNVIVITYHRFLNGKPLMLEEEIARINKRLEEEKAMREAKYPPVVIDKKPHKG